MEKSPDAFRTISEVADLLDTPAHVLRFWESRFPQVRPVKRAGGRRYYRPSDVALLSGIKRLLHSDGLTIRGVQKVLREQGIRHVVTLADHSVADGPAMSADDFPQVIEATVSETGMEADAARPEQRSSVLILGQPDVRDEPLSLPETIPVEDSPKEHDKPILAVEEAVLQILGGGAVAEATMPENEAEADTTEAPTEPSIGEAPKASVTTQEPADEAAPEVWLPARLRSLQAVGSARHRQDLARFHADLTALRARLTESLSGRSR